MFDKIFGGFKKPAPSQWAEDERRQIPVLYVHPTWRREDGIPFRYRFGVSFVLDGILLHTNSFSKQTITYPATFKWGEIGSLTAVYKSNDYYSYDDSKSFDSLVKSPQAMDLFQTIDTNNSILNLTPDSSFGSVAELDSLGGGTSYLDLQIGDKHLYLYNTIRMPNGDDLIDRVQLQLKKVCNFPVRNNDFSKLTPEELELYQNLHFGEDVDQSYIITPENLQRALRLYSQFTTDSKR